MKLYKIVSSRRALLDRIEEMREECTNDEEREDLRAAIADTLEAIDGDFDEKVETIAIGIKEAKVALDGIDAELKTLQARKKSIQAQIDGMTDYVSACMEAVGKDKVETARCKVGYRNTPTAVAFDEYWTVFDIQRYAAWIS